MQLIGNMGNEVKISGVLSDRNIQLDQNGTTTSIETLDQIYLNISHPSFSADAGNIMFNHEYLKDHSIERKLVGIKNKFSANSWNGSSVYAGSRSIFHTLTIQGEDGVQGHMFFTVKMEKEKYLFYLVPRKFGLMEKNKLEVTIMTTLLIIIQQRSFSPQIS